MLAGQVMMLALLAGMLGQSVIGEPAMAGLLTAATLQALAFALLMLCSHSGDQDSRESPLSAHLRSVAGQVPGLVYRYRLRPDGTNHFPFMCGRLAAEFGILPEDVREDAAALMNRVHPDDIQPLMESIEVSAREMSPWRMSLRFQQSDGTSRWMEGSSLPHREPDGSIVWDGVVIDVTERRIAEERYELAVQGSQDGLWNWDLRTDRVFYAPQWAQMLGLDPASITDSPSEWMDRIVGRDQPQFEADLESHIRGATEALESQIEMRHADGSTRYMLCRAVAVRDERGKAIRLAGSLADITQIRETQRQLHYLAEHDTLTGLLSRTAFTARLEQAIARRQQDPSFNFAVLFLDFDHFKFVNDALGHPVGDALLRSSARLIRRNVKILDPAARFGGDEFAVLVQEVDGVEGAAAIARRLIEVLDQPQRIGEQQIRCGASVGIVISDQSHRDTQSILRDADAAMYAAKRSGRGTYRLFDAEMHHAAVQRVRLERGLVTADYDEQFHLVYQPIVDLDSADVTGYEALVRWEHPELGPVRPDQFIPLAEETGEIVGLGAWVLREACRQAAAWRQQGVGRPDAVVHVNVSRRQLVDAGFVEVVASALDDMGLPPRLLKIEITESVIMDNGREIVPVLETLRERGVGLAIDDFGTGHSSLSCLQQFPVDTIKIDRSFITPMSRNRQFAGVVSAVVSLAEHLNMAVVAEGIETPDQLVQLQTLGCRQGQGYFFARPERAAAMAQYLIGIRRALSA